MVGHYPKAREVLECDFSGFRVPEMVKSRPVVIVSCSTARPGLVIVVPLSTTPPETEQPWHHMLSRASQWDKKARWVKCDMLYAVSCRRLSAWKLGGRTPDGKRKYLRNFFVSERDFAAIQAAILKALNIGP